MRTEVEDTRHQTAQVALAGLVAADRQTSNHSGLYESDRWTIRRGSAIAARSYECNASALATLSMPADNYTVAPGTLSPFGSIEAALPDRLVKAAAKRASAYLLPFTNFTGHIPLQHAAQQL